MSTCITLPRKRGAKFSKGVLPCGNCSLHKHVNCRPRQDGTLCTCSCMKAQMIRDEVERKTLKAIAQGKDPESLEQMIEVICPRYRKVF